MVLSRCNSTRLGGVCCRQGWRFGALRAGGASGASPVRLLRAISKVLPLPMGDFVPQAIVCCALGQLCVDDRLGVGERGPLVATVQILSVFVV